MEPRPHARAFVALGLAFLTALAFAGVLRLPFIQFDDAEYVTGNPFLRDGLTWSAAAWAATSAHAANWHPVTWISHLIDVSLFGMSPQGPHAINLLLHCANVALLYVLLDRMTGAARPSMLATALFAVHPLRVESVAWISERKDVLSTFFWLATSLAYVGWVRDRKPARYVAVLLLFALGLASKQMLVTLPFTLLLLDAWPLGRIDVARPAWRTAWPLVREKLPMFGLAIVAAATTFIVQRQAGAARPMAEYSFLQRLENAGVAVLAYLVDTVWPTSLAVFYPHPETPLSVARLAGSLGLLGTITALAWWARRRQPSLIVGWLWFLGTLVPVIGLVQVGNQARADRYTYIPSIGLAIIVAWAISGARLRTRRAQVAGAVAAAAVVGTLAILTVRQVQFWRNDRTLFEHALQVTERNWLAETAIGMDLERKGDLPGAMARYERALAIRPTAPQALNNLGNLLVGIGQRDRGIALLRESVRHWPGYSSALANLGSSLAESGRVEEGIDYLRKAASIAPADASIRYNLGLALLQAGRPGEALAEFEVVCRLAPGDVEARALANRIRARLGRP
jgi:Flp pilus assembly protein TadD